MRRGSSFRRNGCTQSNEQRAGVSEMAMIYQVYRLLDHVANDSLRGDDPLRFRRGFLLKSAGSANEFPSTVGRN